MNLIFAIFTMGMQQGVQAHPVRVGKNQKRSVAVFPQIQQTGNQVVAEASHQACLLQQFALAIFTRTISGPENFQKDGAQQQFVHTLVHHARGPLPHFPKDAVATKAT